MIVIKPFYYLLSWDRIPAIGVCHFLLNLRALEDPPDQDSLKSLGFADFRTDSHRRRSRIQSQGDSYRSGTGYTSSVLNSIQTRLRYSGDSGSSAGIAI